MTQIICEGCEKVVHMKFSEGVCDKCGKPFNERELLAILIGKMDTIIEKVDDIENKILLIENKMI